jgi:hypothetical protein
VVNDGGCGKVKIHICTQRGVADHRISYLVIRGCLPIGEPSVRFTT